MADLEIEIGTAMKTQMLNTLEQVKVTDLVAILDQDPIDHQTELPIPGRPLDEIHVGKTEGKKLIPIFHLPALELDLEVGPLDIDDALELLQPRTGETYSQTE